MVLTKDNKVKTIKKFAQGQGDTGSPEVQIALLMQEVEKLKIHLDQHKHDTSAKRGLLTKIAKRRRLLRYLTSRSKERYMELIKVLGLRR